MGLRTNALWLADVSAAEDAPQVARWTETLCVSLSRSRRAGAEEGQC